MARTLNTAKRRRPFTVYVLLILLFFQAVSAIFGGIALTIDPSGELLQMPLSLLQGSPFRSYLAPGLFLLAVLGVYPLVVLYGMLTLRPFHAANALNIYKEQHWSLTHALYVGIILILWINLQILFIGYGHIIQTLYGLLGVLITIFALLPSVKKYFSSS